MNAAQHVDNGLCGVEHVVRYTKYFRTVKRNKIYRAVEINSVIVPQMEHDPFAKVLSEPAYSNAAIGERLRRVRLDVMHIRTMREMAKRLGVDEKTYEKAEKGYGLSRMMARRVVLACPGMSLDWLDHGDRDRVAGGVLRLLGEAP